MVLDPTSTTQTATRMERPDSAVLANEPGRVRPERPETGATSEAGPAVVVTLSAAARETARPVNEVQQAADEAQAKDAARAAEERDRSREADNRPEASRRPFDLVV